ncbi:MAG: RNA 2',3'-cyclic phosphodiesterase [Deltaproteobacteria bacterium]|nr:RNA 2',3'-cyclic phosphodiesterase [Deltaproteobacteria bacterium]MCZ6906002.1 RNA 2',3'-cyclic phosphodiesterase [Deltaproteobacteria bacterium]
MIRAFVGVRIDPKMTQKISEVQSQLTRSLTGIRWVVQENLHFTLKFLGAVEEEKITSIIKAVGRVVRPAQPFSLTAGGIGVFPDIRKPRVLWVGLEAQGLQTLSQEVEAALEPLGFAPEKRGFKPHLTVGRWRNFTAKAQRLKEEIDHWKDHDFGQSRVEEVVIFQSILKPNGAVYSPLQIITLGTQADLFEKIE